MRTVLVIDDDARMRAVVRTALPDWKVVEADDGTDGLDRLHRERLQPDLVILDMMMTRLDGYDTCMRIREYAPTIPILPFTAAQEAIPFLSEMGCAPAAIKPVSFDELRTAAYRAIGEAMLPLLPGPAVLAVFQRKAAERERMARQAGAVPRQGLFASNPTTRAGLSAFIRDADVLLHVEAASESVLRRSPGAQSLSTLIAAGYDWAPALRFAREYRIPLVVVASMPAEGAAVVLLTRAIALGIVLLDAAFPHALREALVAAQAEQRYISAALRAPFAGSELSPQEQNVVALVLHGLNVGESAEILGVAERSIAQYQTRICQKLAVRGGRGICEWAKEWERTHPPMVA